jgi:Sigma-54 interaction domain
MSKPTTRGGSPPPGYPKCPKCGFNATRTTDVSGRSELERFACDTCQHRWTVARGSKHVQSVPRPELILDGITLPRPRHPRRVPTPSGAPEAWDCLMTSRANALLIGPRHVTGRLVHFLRSQLARPIVRVRSHMPLALPPADQVGTVILEDVDRLDTAAQVYVLEWLERAVPRVRMISTSTLPVRPMVVTGVFDETLYYRLNVLYVRC